jgi:hypothetical protein
MENARDRQDLNFTGSTYEARGPACRQAQRAASMSCHIRSSISKFLIDRE